MVAKANSGQAATEELPRLESWNLLAWACSGFALQSLLLEFATERMADKTTFRFLDPGLWRKQIGWLVQRLPAANPQYQQRVFADGVELWQTILGQFGIGPLAANDGEPAQLPRQDHRFRDAKWRESPFHAILHQAYLMWSERMLLLADTLPNGDPKKREQLPSWPSTLPRHSKRHGSPSRT